MSTGDSVARSVDDAIAAGVAFLRDAQLPTGELRLRRWREAAPDELMPDPSIFGTALIAYSLAGVRGAERILEPALDFIDANMERHGVWRHWTAESPEFHRIPPDLDDTSIASLALMRNRRQPPPNRALLLANRDARGLFFTWITPRRPWVRDAAWRSIALAQLRHPLLHFLFFRRTASRRGDVDAVVNANVLMYLGPSADTEPVVDHIIRIVREERELTCDKWYDNRFSIWYFFSRALRAAGIESAGALLVERVRAARPANALEWALAACVLHDWNATADDAVRAIIMMQQPSGEWPGAALYHGGRIRWGSDELTTGFCIEALSRWPGATRA